VKSLIGMQPPFGFGCRPSWLSVAGGHAKRVRALTDDVG